MISIFTDGSCNMSASSKGKWSGGWAFVSECDGILYRVSGQIQRCLPHTAELTAILMALRHNIGQLKSIGRVVTDCQGAEHSINSRRTPKGFNGDWNEFLNLFDSTSVDKVTWMKRNTHPLLVVADQLAGAEARLMTYQKELSYLVRDEND